MAKVTRKCKYCHEPFVARSADVARGWAKFCSKSCKAKEQERRTGQHAAHKERESGLFSGFGFNESNQDY